MMKYPVHVPERSVPVHVQLQISVIAMNAAIVHVNRRHGWPASCG